MSEETNGKRPEDALLAGLVRGQGEAVRLVRFTDPEEWIEELVCSQRWLVMPFIRLTGLFRQNSQIPFLQSVFCVAGFWTVQEFVELRHFCGERASGEQGEVLQRYNAVRAKIHAACKEAGIEVRGGFYFQAPEERGHV